MAISRAEFESAGSQPLLANEEVSINPEKIPFPKTDSLFPELAEMSGRGIYILEEKPIRPFHEQNYYQNPDQEPTVIYVSPNLSPETQTF